MKNRPRRSVGEGPAGPQTVRRSLVLLGLALVMLSALALRVLLLQTAGYERYSRKVTDQLTTESVIRAGRGTIYDANGAVLATERTAYRVFLSPNRVAYAQREADRAGEHTDYTAVIAEQLSAILGVSQEKLRAELSKTNYLDRTVAREVSETVADRVREVIRAYGLQTMVGVEAVSTRCYPYATLAAQAIGFTGSDGTGLYGLEYSYNEQLSGENGRYVTARDARGNPMPNEYEEYVPASNGNNLHTTLDVFVQAALDEAVETAYTESGGQNRAAGVVMNVNTGAILAMTTYPFFDLNDPRTLDERSAATLAASGLTEGSEEYAALRRELLLGMWSNKAITESYIPGSTFKIITAAMALEENAVRLTETFSCTGYKEVLGFRIHCHKTTGHGTLTFVEGIQQSCNPVLMSVGLRLGGSTFYRYLEAFGFLEKTGVDLPGEGSSVVIARDAFTDLDLAIYSFGQNFNVTLLQQITAVSAVANGGRLVTPHLVDHITDADGNTVWKFDPSARRQTVSKETCQTVADILEKGVSGDGGAKNAYVAGYRVAAKTGTSQKKNAGSLGRYVCSTVAFAPADDPQYAVILIVDEPTAGVLYGSTVAAPYVGAVMERILPYLGVEAVYSDTELGNRALTVPPLVGSDRATAEKTCRENGFACETVGEGSVVLRQSPAAGTVIEKDGARVILYCGESAEDTEEKTAQVPDVTGMTPAEANRALVDAGLNIRVTGVRNHAGADGVKVISQSAPAGSQLPRGSVVEICLRSLTDRDLDEEVQIGA